MLKTERCLIKPIEESHFDGIHQLYVNEKVRKYLGGIRTDDEITKIFSHMLHSQNSFYWTIFEKSSLSLIGLVSITPHHDANDLEISYQFLPDWWGSGYATEVVQEVIHYAFETLKMTKLVAETQTANDASCKLLENIGMKKVKTVTRFGAEQTIYNIIA